MAEQNNTKISGIIIASVIAVLAIGIGWSFTRTESLAKQIDVYQANVQLVQVSQASMTTDLIWIKSALLKMQESIDKLK